MIGKLPAIFGVQGLRLAPSERDFFRDGDPFGFILFGRNVESPAQVRLLCDDLRTSVGRDAPIFIDQEGGRVQRLRAPHWRQWRAPLDLMQTAQNPARVAWLQARLIANELHSLGIDGNCAPCCDIADEHTHAFLRNRCYGTTPDQVLAYAGAAAAGYLAGGVLPVIKHMPGHGRAQVDSHKALPRVTAPREILDAVDFAPFRGLAHLPLAMTAHILYTLWDDTRPATQSSIMMQVIREEIGFQGLLMSDDLGMEALSGDLGVRTTAAIGAGCDVALHCSAEMDDMVQVAQACGPWPARASARAQAALAQRIRPDPLDTEALEAALAALFTPDMPAPFHDRAYDGG